MEPSSHALSLIYECIDELNAQFGGSIAKNEAQPLFGPGGLDSLGFVNFVSALEEKLADQFGVELVLADEQQAGAFTTLGELAHLITQRMP